MKVLSQNEITQVTGGWMDLMPSSRRSEDSYPFIRKLPAPTPPPGIPNPEPTLPPRELI